MSRASWCDSLRRTQYRLHNIFTKCAGNSKLIKKHQTTQIVKQSTKWLPCCLKICRCRERKERLRNCSRLEKAKQILSVNALCDFSQILQWGWRDAIKDISGKIFFNWNVDCRLNFCITVKFAEFYNFIYVKEYPGS